MSVNPFVNSSKMIPKSDSQIVRVPMDSLEIGGRKGHLPAEQKPDRMSLKHVGTSSNGSGG
jgi:hypothetical protein